MDNIRVPKNYVPIMYLLGTLIFLEWIYPTKEVANTTNITVFILFTLFCTALTIVRFPAWFANLLRGLAILFIIHSLFMKPPFLSLEWIKLLFNEFHTNMSLLLSWDLIELSSMFRTVLFLILIWLMVYFIHYWFVAARKFLLFIILTIIYLSILDSFTGYDASWAMIRTFVLSFLALGYANFFKQTVDQPLKVKRRRGYYSWKLPIFLIVITVSTLAYILPKFSAQWPDPIPFIKSMSEHTPFSKGEDGNTQMGLSEDDSRLGGSFTTSEEVVFEAISTGHGYWRVDSKDFYTGKGWINSEVRVSQPVINGEVKLGLYDFEVERTAKTAIVSFVEDEYFPKLPYPYEIVNIYSEDENMQSFISHDSHGAVEVPEENLSSFQNYGLVYAAPTFDVDRLRGIEIRDSSIEALGHRDHTRYTQLPRDLPTRVGGLAMEITQHFQTDYDKVKAIESYFHTSGFRYKTEGVPYPAEEEDYVDQFLFETKYGYCDNFSTSMVVMLRSLGFPARWAKGYTAGEVVERNVDYSLYEESLNIPKINTLLNKYEIKNTNAHSWVEVFFPDVGWVPFEPTQGFANHEDFISSNYGEEDMLEAEEGEVNLEEEDQQSEDINEELGEEEEESVVVAKKGSKTPLYLFLGVLIVLLFAIVVFRVRLMFAYYKYLLVKKPSQENYERAYIYLLKLLGMKGMQKKQSETLREYAKKIDHRYKVNDMGDLTYIYEQLLYREAENINNYKISQLWENMVRRVIA